MKKHTAWSWIPTLYFAEGLPYVAITTLSLIMYKRMGISNAECALYTAWLGFPWVIKPLWSPFVDLIKTKRYWILAMQMLLGAGFAGIAFTIPTESFLQTTMFFFSCWHSLLPHMTLLPTDFICFLLPVTNRPFTLAYVIHSIAWRPSQDKGC